jgi:hypothetical protein
VMGDTRLSIHMVGLKPEPNEGVRRPFSWSRGRDFVLRPIHPVTGAALPSGSGGDVTRPGRLMGPIAGVVPVRRKAGGVGPGANRGPVRASPLTSASDTASSSHMC